jgi:phage tail-like protein
MDAKLIAKLLPSIFRAADQPGSVLNAVLGVMEDFIAPVESALDGLDRWFDPRRAPDDFLRMLGTWVALEPYLGGHDRTRRDGLAQPAIDPGNLRELVARAAEHGRLRGTRLSLLTMLEIATGLPGFSIEENVPANDGGAVPYHFRLAVPASGRHFEGIIARIVEQEKPAFTTAEIVYQQE